MYSSEPNPNGVWTHIVAHTPPPEVEELAKIIGKKLIDTNEDLWHELCALKEIVADFLTFEFGNLQLKSSSTKSTPERIDKSTKKKTNCSKSHQNNDHSSLSQAFESVDEFIHIVKDSLSVARVYEVLPFIQEALMSERKDLESEIALMQTTMDTESEVISRGNTPRRDHISESFGVSSSPSAGGSSPISSGLSSKSFNHEVSRKLAESASAPVHKSSVVIIGPGRIRRSDSRSASDKVGSKGGDVSSCRELTKSSLTCSTDKSLDNDVTVNYALEKSNNDQSSAVVSPLISLNGPSPSSSRSNSGNGSTVTRSRMRSRIESARDERFFMDEDIFMH